MAAHSAYFFFPLAIDIRKAAGQDTVLSLQFGALYGQDAGCFCPRTYPVGHRCGDNNHFVSRLLMCPYLPECRRVGQVGDMACICPAGSLKVSFPHSLYKGGDHLLFCFVRGKNTRQSSNLHPHNKRKPKQKSSFSECAQQEIG